MLSETEALVAAMALLRTQDIHHTGVRRVMHVRLGPREVEVLRRFGIPARVIDRWSVVFGPPAGQELRSPEELLVAVDAGSGVAWLVDGPGRAGSAGGPPTAPAAGAGVLD